MKKPLVPDHIRSARLYPPVKPLEEIKRELGITDVTKLNANENNAGPSPMAIQAIRDAASNVHRYPDNSAYYLKQKLADKYRLAPELIMLGNGSNELVQFKVYRDVSEDDLGGDAKLIGVMIAFTRP